MCTLCFDDDAFLFLVCFFFAGIVVLLPDNSCFLTSYAGSLLGGVYVPCIYRMPGGVIIGDLGRPA